MAGTRRFKLLIGIFIPIFAVFLMSHNTFAANNVPFSIYYRSYKINDGSVVNQAGFSNTLETQKTLLSFEATTPLNNKALFGYSVDFNLTDNEQGKYKTLTVNFTYGQGVSGAYNSIPDDVPATIAVGFSNGESSVGNCTSVRIPFGGSNNYGTRFTCKFYDDGYNIFTNAQVRVGSYRNTVLPALVIGNVVTSYSAVNSNGPLVVRDLDYNVEVTQDPSLAFLNSINEQQQTQINLQIQENQQLNEMNDREQQGIDNISNQSPNDIQGSTNQQTTSLINVISGFISAFSNINATNCNLTLEFPDFAGGTRIVNICSGKDKAPRIVEIGSSLLLICVFVPLAFVLIRMIYNEIRSWTNG